MEKECNICGREFKITDTIVRVVVEAVRYNNGDEKSVFEWSQVLDWDVPHIYHIGCVKRALDNDILFPCNDIVDENIPINDICENIKTPSLRVL